MVLDLAHVLSELCSFGVWDEWFGCIVCGLESHRPAGLVRIAFRLIVMKTHKEQTDTRCNIPPPHFGSVLIVHSDADVPAHLTLRIALVRLGLVDSFDHQLVHLRQECV